MVMIQSGRRLDTESNDDAGRFQAGPVFVPPRRPSAYARQLMEESTGVGESVTAYDEFWFAGRPTV